MTYKDKTFEIDDEQIKFENKTFILYLSIFIAMLSSTFFINRHNLIVLLCSFFGMALGLTIAFRVFLRLYWKSTINLSDISFVELKSWNSDIDKMRNFWGIPKFRYHFPTGFDKKSNSKVIFVHLNKEKLAIGFAPTNCIATISAFQEKGIKVVENN
jgi:hypothetical protein